jgi:hypothetical protein
VIFLDQFFVRMPERCLSLAFPMKFIGTDPSIFADRWAVTADRTGLGSFGGQTRFEDKREL